MDIVSRPGVKAIKIKRSKNVVKFKAQTSANLYTLVVADLGKAKKIETELKRKFLFHLVSK